MARRRCSETHQNTQKQTFTTKATRAKTVLPRRAAVAVKHEQRFDVSVHSYRTSRESLDGRRQLGQDGTDVLGEAAAGSSTLSRNEHHLQRGVGRGWGSGVGVGGEGIKRLAMQESPRASRRRVRVCAWTKATLYGRKVMFTA